MQPVFITLNLCMCVRSITEGQCGLWSSLTPAEFLVEESHGEERKKNQGFLPTAKIIPLNYNDGALGERGTLKALHSCLALLSLLLPLTASSPCFLSNLHPRTHTHTRAHPHTHSHGQMHIHKHQTCSSHKAGLYSLGRVSALYVFAPVCVYMCVRVCARWYFLSRAGYQPQTYLPLSFHLFLFLSLTVLLFPSIRCGP